MEKQKNIPKLRFPEFEGEWEKMKLGDIATVTAGGTPSTLKSEYWNGTIRWMNSGELNLKRVYEVENRITDEGLKNSSTKLIPKYSVLIGLAGQGKTRGTVAMNMIELCTNQSIASVYPNNTKFNSDFLYHNLDKRYDELRMLSTGEGGRGGLNLQIIKSLVVNLPSLPEQQKIASFFTAIDQKISQLKRKKTLLEEYKKGVMQKIFSQQIRFKDDYGQEFPKWEKIELGEVLLHKTVRNKERKVTMVLSVSNTKGFITQDEQFDNHRVASTDVSNYKIVIKNDFAYNPSRINVGSIARLTDYNEGIVSPMYVVFGLKESMNAIFFENWIDTHKFKYMVRTSCSGSVRESLNFEDMCNFPLRLPSLQEQTKIASFLSAIDDKINHTQKQIEKAEVWKKGLMQQMFV